MILNEQIWSAMDRSDHLLAAELCLFAEHIYTGNDEHFPTFSTFAVALNFRFKPTKTGI